MSEPPSRRFPDLSAGTAYDFDRAVFRFGSWFDHMLQLTRKSGRRGREQKYTSAQLLGTGSHTTADAAATTRKQVQATAGMRGIGIHGTPD